MGLLQVYLILFNLASCGGWAFVGAQVFLAATTPGEDASTFWAKAGPALLAVQSLAALEIAHSLLRLVRSPIMTAFMQVMSRLIVLWVYTYPAPECKAHWSLLLMVGSWACVEVPRYLFYALNLLPAFAGSKMPYPLFYLRYSLFMVLYPTGISGELLQMYVALSSFYTWGTPLERLLFVFPFIAYPPSGPFMIFHMWMNRKSQFKKRRLEKAGSGKPAAAKKKAEGLVWPVTNDATGERSTSVTNQAIWAASVAVSPEAATAVRQEKKWRFGYAKHVERQVRVALESRAKAVSIATDGLAAANELFEFVREGSEPMSLAAAMKKFPKSFRTGFIQGQGTREVQRARVLYKGQELEGDALAAQMDRWAAEGVCEPSAADAVKACIAHPEWVDLSDSYFVLLGATSAMGPLDLLLACGANIVAIDIDRPNVWKTLVSKARASPGTLTFPLSKNQESIADDEELFACAGANLLAQTPEIANWIVDVAPGKPLTVGNYTYLDGALHVQLSIACDAIMAKVCAARSDTSIAFLCTPTDVHSINKEAHEAAAENYAAAPLWAKFFEAVLGKNDMVSNVLEPVQADGGADSETMYLMDGITVPQGPNYALAKRMQHWRAVLARDAGHTVSSNVAPSTATKSVTSNRLFAAAYEGFCLFKALEVMQPETSSSVMLALLINDLRNPKSVANAKVDVGNPMRIFAYNAFHGGSFRSAYKVSTIGTVCVLYFVASSYGFVVLPVLGAFGFAAKFVALGP